MPLLCASSPGLVPLRSKTPVPGGTLRSSGPPSAANRSSVISTLHWAWILSACRSARPTPVLFEKERQVSLSQDKRWAGRQQQEERGKSQVASLGTQ